MPFSRVLYALGIPGVGFVNAEKLAEHFGTMDALLEAQPEQIEQAEGIGPVLAEQIYEELPEERSEELIERLRKAGLRMELDASERRRRGRAAGGQDARAHRDAARPHPRGGDEADQARRRARSSTRSRRRPTTSSPGTARARSWPRPRSWAPRCSTSRGLRKLVAVSASFPPGDRVTIQRPMPRDVARDLVRGGRSRLPARGRTPWRPCSDSLARWPSPARRGGPIRPWSRSSDGMLRVDGIPGYAEPCSRSAYSTAGEAGFGGVSDRFLVTRRRRRAGVRRRLRLGRRHQRLVLPPHLSSSIAADPRRRRRRAGDQRRARATACPPRYVAELRGQSGADVLRGGLADDVRPRRARPRRGCGLVG